MDPLLPAVDLFVVRSTPSGSCIYRFPLASRFTARQPHSHCDPRCNTISASSPVAQYRTVGDLLRRAVANWLPQRPTLSKSSFVIWSSDLVVTRFMFGLQGRRRPLLTSCSKTGKALCSGATCRRRRNCNDWSDWLRRTPVFFLLLLIFGDAELEKVTLSLYHFLELSCLTDASLLPPSTTWNMNRSISISRPISHFTDHHAHSARWVHTVLSSRVTFAISRLLGLS